jgi:hypothetical protein
MSSDADLVEVKRRHLAAAAKRRRRSYSLKTAQGIITVDYDEASSGRDNNFGLDSYIPRSVFLNLTANI